MTVLAQPAETAPLAHQACRLAYLVSHPIQYQAGFLRLIARQRDIDLTVFFERDPAGRGYRDRGFNRPVHWDVPLLDGYRHEFLDHDDRGRRRRAFNAPFSARLMRGEFDALWVHGYARLGNWLPMLAAKSASLRVFLRDDMTETARARSPARTLLKRALLFPALRGICDAVLATGTLNRDYYTRHGIDPARIFLVPNTVDNDYFARGAEQAAPRREALRAELGLAPGRAIILFAGKLQPVKRVRDLIAAVNALGQRGRNARPYLLVVGEGATRSLLEHRAASISGDVRFLGFRNQSELPALYDLCDVFVLPSEHETFGLVVNEVMSVGRAVIVSDRVGCWPDLVRQGVNGYVFPHGNVAALAEALAKVLADPDLCRAMGEESRRIIGGWGFAQALDGLRAAIAATAVGTVRAER